MSVIVKGMEMPESCDRCLTLRLSFCMTFRCYEKFPLPDGLQRLPDCPLRPLPEKHGRLISADEAYDRIMEQEGGNYIDMDGVGMGLDECRTIVEAEE